MTIEVRENSCDHLSMLKTATRYCTYECNEFFVPSFVYAVDL